MPLDNGVGRLQLAGPLDVLLRVYDAQGAAVAERPFKDVTGNVPSNRYVPPVRGW
jgi:hypothetical protein